MASISSDPNGRRRVLFIDAAGTRRAIRLGKVERKTAETVKSRVESIVGARLADAQLDAETAKWLAGIPDRLHEKLADAGLVEPRTTSQLKPWLDRYVASRADLKEGSLRKLMVAARKLVEFFGETRNIRTITPEQASAWRAAVAKQPGRKRNGVTKPMSEATLKTLSGDAKGMFAHAVTVQKLIPENPFAHLASGPTSAQTDRYITPEEARKVMDAMTDHNLRVLFALCRFGGLRVRSEAMGLKWGDINWETRRMLVRSPKTERHRGHEARVVPIAPSLMTELQDAFDKAKSGAERVVDLHWTGSVFNRTNAAVYSSGVTPWPALFQTLRSSCEIEWAMAFPQFAVSRWIGHSIAISGKHYANMVPDELYDAAAERAAHQAAQRASAMASNSGDVRLGDVSMGNRKSDACRELPIAAGVGEMGDEGFEPKSTTRKHLKNAMISPEAARQAAHVPPDLQRIIAAWATMSMERKAAALTALFS